MPYSINHGGLNREFDFYAPTDWQHWVGEAWKKGRTGLPLVVAFHGGGQNPLDFQEKWFFPRVWNLDLDANGNPGNPIPPGGDRVLENQFFVLYPYGTGWSNESLRLLANGTIEPPALPDLPPPGPSPAWPDLMPLYRHTDTLRGWNIGVGDDRMMVDDLGFVAAAIEAMDIALKTQLLYSAKLLPSDFPWQYRPGPVGVLIKEAPTMFDVDRRNVFGYSNGAMFGHRLVGQMPDYWAAFWAQSGTCGGKATIGATEDQLVVVNLPASGDYATSFFAHHGDADTTVPPGAWGEDDFVYQSPQLPSPSYLLHEIAGFPDRLEYLPALLPLSQASRGYRTFDNVDGQSPFRFGPDLNGGNTAQSKSWPDVADPNDANPLVVIYRDPFMEHGGFTESPNRYFFEKDVWRFFGYHPRITR
jgi:predicted esterase